MNARPARLLRLGLLSIPLVTLGCAGRGPLIDVAESSLPPGIELVETEFFPQRKYHCGPAALASVLRHAQVKVAPDQLVDQVYVPGRRGALQAEMLAATRRHRRVAYPLPPTRDALLAELASGRPVLVLQNLGLRRWPVWHYAVLIGYDTADDTVILRSGATRRLLMPARRFFRTWERAGRWAFVALQTDAVPAVPDRPGWLTAIAALEGNAPPEDLERAYLTYLSRYPGDPAATLGLANALQAQGRALEAEALYRELLAQHPGYVPARNNLAWSLSERNCVEEALVQVEAAIREVGEDNPSYREALADTRRRIVGIPRGAEESCTGRGD